MSRPLKLYDYWRSTAGYRVRIALQLKGLAFERVAVDLRPGQDEQRSTKFLQVNPQGRVPVLVDGDLVITQSMAILHWLETRTPSPHLYPSDAEDAAFAMQIAQTIVSDIHPIGNVGVLSQLTARFGADDDAKAAWSRRWIERGFDAIEHWIAARRPREDGDFVLGARISIADVCLVPQVYNAKRWGVDMAAYPRIAAIDAAARQSPPFAVSAPEAQSDAPANR